MQVPMWVSGQQYGQWAFMSSCAAQGFLDNRQCNQQGTTTTTGIGGSQLSVVPSYQVISVYPIL